MPVRGTQSLVHMMSACWRRPSLLALELLWRWSFGALALAILVHEGLHILAEVPLSRTGISNFSLTDPMGSVQVVSTFVALLIPPILRVALWLSPLLAVLWAIVSGLGRSLVLKRMDPAMRFAPGSLIVLQLLRILALSALCIGWFLAIRWAAAATLGAEPNLVGYFAWVICLSLGTFTLWALVSWVFSIAPLLAMLEGGGILGSLAHSFRLGALTGKLVEVNLVMSIIKLALIILASVFSALPLPFTADISSGMQLYAWWAGVGLLYFAAVDFFQVARLAVFVQFWRIYLPHPAGDGR